ncbi:hypothetical protein I79_005357 [Cricetulus griseus]|uniref:Uncharacterized protein n=1 Tax=Cricetulus griseus TaxID=10029 RepID=G3H4Z3_CRIGR|nr:hypothetical protein I79_005357 [Cricetulus griseus]
MQLSDIAPSRDGTTAEHNGHMICCGMKSIPGGAGVYTGRGAWAVRPGLGAKRLEGL